MTASSDPDPRSGLLPIDDEQRVSKRPTLHPRAADPHDREEISAEAPVDAWEELLRAQRNRNRLFLLSVLIFAILIVGYMITSLMQANRVRDQEEVMSAIPPKALPTPEGLHLRTPNLIDGPSRKSMVFLLDNLQDVEEISAIPAGGAPFESKWVMQAGAYLARAQTAMQRGHHDEALEYFSLAGEIFPNLEGVQAFLGLLRLQKEEYRQAIVHLNRAVGEDPLDHSLLNNLGVAYLALQEYPAAERNFRECIRLRPDYDMGHYNLASMYFEQENYTSVLETLPSYMNLKPDNIEAAQMLARSFIVLERWDEAKTTLERIQKLQPGVPAVLFRLAQCQAMVGDHTGGIDTLRRVVRLVDRSRALSWLSRNEFNILRSDDRFQALIEELSREPE